MFLLGYDLGSSFIKAALIDARTGKLVASASSPNVELPIDSPRPDWAEQAPEFWWRQVKAATAQIIRQQPKYIRDIKAIGISYQMHGLVVVDKAQRVLRPAIIWCDSRAVGIGDRAFLDLKKAYCLKHFCNSPGNFTASKLRWVKEHEPDVYKKIDKIILPGEYIAMRMTGEAATTPSGLSEGIFWDFQQQQISQRLLDHFKIDRTLIPKVYPNFGVQGTLTSSAAAQLGLPSGIPISYRAGDQPNNAFSLNVLEPGELATTAGTSGVVYGVTDKPLYDPQSRVNTFVHVNHTPRAPRNGVLLCINGTGSLNRWLKQLFSIWKDVSYEDMNDLAREIPVGSDDLRIFPYGNGAERTLNNKILGASVEGLDFNRHQTGHLLRAAQEGIVFAMNHGLDIMREMGLKIKTVKAGEANLFLSPVFCEAFVNTTGATLELYNTDGAQGAARGAGVGCGIYKKLSDAFVGLHRLKVIEPKTKSVKQYREVYSRWAKILSDKKR